MKKYLISFVFTLIGVAFVNAQKTLGYIPLANSNNDPAQYLINNFENQKAKYIGQPISKILNNLELKILSHSPLNRVPSGMTGKDKRYIVGVYLRFYNTDEFIRKTDAERKQMKFYSFTIRTKDLLLREEYEALYLKIL